MNAPAALFNHMATAAPVPELVANLLQLKGQFVRFGCVRDLKLKVGAVPVQKASLFTCRVGVDYDNIRDVIAKRESGELPAENAGLPWGRWHTFPYVIEHNDKWYFRCTSVKSSMPETAFRRAGVIITKEEAMEFARSEEKREDRDNDVFNVTIDNIVTLNGERVRR